MTFNEAIENIMSLVKDGNKDIPFIIGRRNGEYEVDYVNLKPDRYAEALAQIREHDPFAVMFTGYDLAKGSFPYVYDKVLGARLRAEYDVVPENSPNKEAYHALVNMLEDNMGEVESDVTDYITRFDNPLASLNKMVGFSLESKGSNYGYNEDRAGDALDIIHNKVTDMINQQTDEPHSVNSEKRVIEGYEEKMNIELAGITVVLAENLEKSNPYLVCNIDYENPLAMEHRYDAIVTDNFLEAMREFMNRVDGLLVTLETERSNSGLPFQLLTAAECLPDGKEKGFENKLIIVKADYLAPEHRSAEYQLVFCTGGFGSKPDSHGSAVFAEELYSGKKCGFRSHQIEGLADPSKIPHWAQKKLSVLQEVKETPGTFKFGSYHFVPYRKFKKGEVDRQLKGDSRPWKMDAQYAMRNMSSDMELGLSKYSWKKAEYSHEKFFAASGNNECDIFRCIENGKLYVPCENELFQYKEPLQRKRAKETVNQINNGDTQSGSFIQVYITNRKTPGDDKKGAWLLLPATADMLRETLKSIDVNNGIYHISKIKAVKNEINRLLPTTSGLDELNMLAHYLNDMESWERNKLDVILKSGVSSVDSVAGLINLLYEDNFNGFNMIAASNVEELGRYWVMEDINNIPEGMSYSEYGIECQTDENGVFIDDCYIYEKYSSEQLYNGVIPEEFQISKCAVEIDSGLEDKKPPSFQEKLDNAKKKAKENEPQKNGGDKDKTKKKGEAEVD